MINIASDIYDAPMKALVNFYNAHAQKPVKRFSDREAAERRCLALFEEGVVKAKGSSAAKASSEKPAAEKWAGYTHCPHCKIDLDNGVTHWDDRSNETGERLNDKHEYECMACGGGFGKVMRRGASAGRNSEKISASWNDKKVRAARCQRSAVVVDGTEYRSVKAAFIALGLPVEKHIPFRMELKAASRAVKAFDRSWKIKPLNY